MTARIALALLFIVPAAMAYPWPTTFDRWVLGVAVAVVLLLFIGWRGMFFTTMVRRRLAMLGRRKAVATESGPDVETVVVRVDAADRDDELPLSVIARYRERYGIRADTVRITSCERSGSRTSWVSLTVRAVDNLDALRARSAQLPLRDTVVVSARRLADHLREIGWHATIIDATDAPAVAGKEKWRGVQDDAGWLAAYRVSVDEQLPERLAEVWSQPATEIWAAIEISGGTAQPAIAVGCALRTADKPASKAPIAGLTPQRGLHRPALAALAPTSGERLIGDPVPLQPGLLDSVPWTVAGPKGAPRHRRREAETAEAVAVPVS